MGAPCVIGMPKTSGIDFQTHPTRHLVEFLFPRLGLRGCRRYLDIYIAPHLTNIQIAPFLVFKLILFEDRGFSKIDASVEVVSAC